MGRMLETLKKGSKQNVDHCVVDWTMPEPEEVPYIEVGGGKKLEGSSQVMAVKHPPQPAVQPPHPPTEKNLASTMKTVHLTEAKPMGVAFEAWPAMQVPSRGIAPEIVTFHEPNHPVSRQYGALFGKILEGQNGPGTKAILFSGSKSTVGTTTALLNIAVVAALQDKRRLVLVDAHLLRPSLAQRLGLPVLTGLQEVLAGNAALEPAVLKTPVAGMYLVAARAEDNTSIGHLNPEAMAWVVSWLKERFDLVLIDGPDMEEAAEVIKLAPLCDGMYLVVPQAEIAPSHRAMALSLGRQGGRLKGLIHTHCEM